MTFTDNAVFPTFEGVNVMLYQQSFRYAQKLMKKQRAGKKTEAQLRVSKQLERTLILQVTSQDCCGRVNPRVLGTLPASKSVLPPGHDLHSASREQSNFLTEDERHICD